MKRSALKWELIGIAIISVLGSSLHFIFELSGEWPPIGVIAAVNESVFEHLKLTFWPTIIYAAITYKLLKKSTSNFIIAKAAGVYVMPIVITVLFYAYTTITGAEFLIIDIAIFVVAVACGQLTSAKILSIRHLPISLHWLALALIIILGAIYGIFTFHPPHVPLLLDTASGTYGIH